MLQLQLRIHLYRLEKKIIVEFILQQCIQFMWGSQNVRSQDYVASDLPYFKHDNFYKLKKWLSFPMMKYTTLAFYLTTTTKVYPIPYGISIPAVSN